MERRPVGGYWTLALHLTFDLRPSFVFSQEKDSVDPLTDSTDLIQQLVEDGFG